MLQFAATIGAVEKALRARMITPFAKEETILFLFAFREHISRNTRSIFANLFGFVTHDRGSVLLYRRCDMYVLPVL